MKYKPNMTPEEKELFYTECLIALNVVCRNSLNQEKEPELTEQYNIKILQLLQEKNNLDKTEQPYYGA